MELLNWLLEALRNGLPMLVVLVCGAAVLAGLNIALRRRWKGRPELQFRFQLIMLFLTLGGVLALLLTLPISDSLRGQLLSLLGILLSAAIALSSTTFIGNMMAGIMLRLIQNARPGDFISVADIRGRITEMDLLHTEVQTEDRDLVTIPNLLMVTQPLRRARASGTIVSCEVSLGYDVSRRRIAEALRDAVQRAGLEDGFVQVRGLGDFSVTYRAAGLLADSSQLISARSELHEAVLDALHDAGIEIVSPNFMNTRALSPEARILPPTEAKPVEAPKPRAESVAFDKAEEAASVEQLRDLLGEREDALGEEKDEARRKALQVEIVNLRERIDAAREAQKQDAD
ncbi:mechanosensitive ion channel family protein [Pseudomarimonas salicorniae]|uniref:Small-conductance mechanosensitive channel n=1 Tax=Pseudomarimonas salicorniae TaxID=2933270 RepID=A0ABT0GM91_9GAMM|nr:mechanosensitive ion channel family protein [Lysobacter sp. CAU 1642]MCK7595487.1 mechanosensitive ion channel family protein [Lysobacter sp. CAU 1642]